MPDDFADLTALAHDVADRAQLPAFDLLVDRSRRRRRTRGVAISAAASIAVLGVGLAAVQLGDSGHRPVGVPPVTVPAAPTPSAGNGTPATPEERLRAMSAEQIVARGELYSYGSGGSGTVLTVWGACVDHHLHCRYAWRLSTGTGAVVGLTGSGGSAPAVHAAGGRYVVKAWNRPGIVVRPDGSVAELHQVAPGTLGPASMVVRSGPVGLSVVDAENAGSWRLPRPAGTEGFVEGAVGSGPVVWTLPMDSGGGTVQVRWRTGDGAWHTHVVATGGIMHVPADLAVSGRRVAALSSFDGATVSPVGTLAVTTDGGATWTHLGKGDVPFATVDSMAATATGVLFVAEPDGSVWRSSDGSWTRFVKVAGVGPVDGLEPAGADVLARTATAKAGLDLVSPDGTVTPVTVR